MPETQDWAAAPQTGIIASAVATLAPTFAVQQTAVLFTGIAGQRAVIVGLDVWAQTGGISQQIQGVVQVQLQESVGLTIMTGAAVSPESPSDHVRPPFGALVAPIAAGLTAIAQCAGDIGQAVIG